MYGGYPGVAVGRMKQKLEKYQEIVVKLLNEEKLDAEELDFLKKDGIELDP